MSGKPEVEKSSSATAELEEGLEELSLSSSSEFEGERPPAESSSLSDGGAVGVFEISKRPKSEFKICRATLLDGRLYYCKTALRPSVKSLKQLVVAGSSVARSQAHAPKRAHVLAVAPSNGDPTWSASFASTSDLCAWEATLTQGAAAGNAPPPASDANRDAAALAVISAAMGGSKRTNVGERAKKRIAGDLASSGVGKRVMKHLMNDEMTGLMAAFKAIVSQVEGKQKANQLQRDVTKLMVKSYLLIENKDLSPDAFLATDKSLRQAFELMIKCFNAKSRVVREVLQEALQVIYQHLQQVYETLRGLLKPHLSPKSLYLLATVFGILNNPEFLLKVFTEDALTDHLEKLIDSMQYYTQFNV